MLLLCAVPDMLGEMEVEVEVSTEETEPIDPMDEQLTLEEDVHKVKKGTAVIAAYVCLSACAVHPPGHVCLPAFTCLYSLLSCICLPEFICQCVVTCDRVSESVFLLNFWNISDFHGSKYETVSKTFIMSTFLFLTAFGFLEEDLFSCVLHVFNYDMH